MNINKLFTLLLCCALAFSCCSCKDSSSSSVETVTEVPTTAESPTDIKKIADIGNMSFGTAFYKPEMGAVLYNVDISKLDDFEKLIARCVQGLAAREESAQIYLSEDDNDAFWLSRLKDEYGIIVKELDFPELANKFSGLIENIYIYNSENEYETADAVYQASQQNMIAVPRDRTEKYAKFAQPELTATTQATTAQTTPSKAQSETNNKTAPKMFAAVVSPQCKFIDYIYAVSAPVIYADYDNKDDLKRVRELLAGNEFDRPAVLFCEDERFADIASENGFGVLNISGFSNATCFSSFSNTDLSNGVSSGTSRYSEEIDKYVSIEIIDDGKTDLGSNLSYLFKNTRRGSTPITVSISPALYELAPPIASWYSMGRRAATSLSADCTGYMTVNADKMEGKYLDIYLERSQKFLSSLGLYVMNAKLSESAAKNIGDAFGQRGIIGAQDSGVTVIEIDSIYSFNSYTLPESDSPFYCIKIKAGDITTSTFQQLENLVLNIQEANENTEFMLCEDLFPTVNMRNQSQTTTATEASNAQ